MSRNGLKAWIPALLWAGLIFYVSSMPNVKLPGGEFDMKDKLAHASAFAVLAGLVFGACRNAVDVRAAAGLGLLGVIAYGFTDEVHQRFVPGRYCDPYDFLADSAGAILAFLIFTVLIRSSEKRDEVQVT